MRAVSLLFLGLFGCPPVAVDSDSDSDTELPPGCEDVDADEDGVDSCSDCADDDPLVFPGADERCNGVDDNCDELLGWMEDDLSCEACDEAGYWTVLDGLSGQDLEDAVFEALSEHRCSDYGLTTTWMFTNLDKHDGEVECVYTGRTTPVGSDKPGQNDMNTEHTWPQSLGAESYPARCDLNHLFPSDALANNKRGSLPFGIVSSGTSWSEGGSKLGNDASGEEVFEPRDAHKGDAARAMLYFAIRYRDRLEESAVEAMLGDGRRELFEQWHADDPPSPEDIERSLSIAAYQGFANPLVVCPGIVDRLP